MGWLLLVLLVSGTDDPVAAARTSWPCQIAVSPNGPSVIPRIWTFSLTFQRQCRRLAEEKVVVVVQWATDLMPWHRAATRILRDDGRVFRAVVRLRASDEPAVQLIHELEHVMEALDGIDQRSPGCGWRTGGGAYETARARRVEAVARRELELGRPAAPDTSSAAKLLGEETSAAGRSNTRPQVTNAVGGCLAR
jgi:hypothetical protein